VARSHTPTGGNAHLLSVGSVEGAHAVHGTEMFGIVGQTRPDASDEQIGRDTFVRDTVLALAEGNINVMWDAVTAEPTTKGGSGR
jgi:para-nitrobenzyl esterase